MLLKKDIWRCAIVAAPLQDILARGSLGGLPLTWIPASENLRYLADPFGLWRGNKLYIFTEKFDYRDAIGRITVNVYDYKLLLIEQSVVLREPWHLSYPFVFEAEGETWMLPEAYQSSGLWLYRAKNFPHRWERAYRIALDHVPLDATPMYDGERWWLFYAPAYPVSARLTHLCASWAERLTGPWIAHPSNPIFVDSAGARPGGSPVWHDNAFHMPLQDCRGTYGAGLRIIRFEQLSPVEAVVEPCSMLKAPTAAEPFTEGCHTLSAAGDVTLIDVKRRTFSPRALAMRSLRAFRGHEASIYPNDLSE